MTNGDKKQFAQIMAKIAIASSREISESTLEVFFEVLECFTIEEVSAAGKVLLKTWDRPGMLPTPAQFRESILNGPQGPSKKEIDLIFRRYREDRKEDWDAIFMRELGITYQHAMNIGLAL